MDCWIVLQLLALLNSILLSSAYRHRHIHSSESSCEDHGPKAQTRINYSSSNDDSNSDTSEFSEEVIRGRTETDIRVMNRRGVEGGENRTKIVGITKLILGGPDRITFPTSEPFQPRNLPEQCNRTGICEELMDYPEDHVKQLVKQLGDTIEQFKSDEIVPVIASRLGSSEQKVCRAIEKVAIPKAAPDKDGIWRFIVNQKEALQGVRVEICHAMDTDLSQYIDAKFGYKIGCKQEFMIRYLYALDDRGRMVPTPITLPSCCAFVLIDN